jgi:hypothetical protein
MIPAIIPGYFSQMAQSTPVFCSPFGNVLIKKAGTLWIENNSPCESISDW